MTGTALLGIVSGAGAGGGLLLVIAGIRGRDGAAEPRTPRLVGWLRGGGGLRLGAAALSAVAVLLVTGWVAVAAAVAAMVAAWPTLFGGARAERAAMERLEALAAWTESLRDSIVRNSLADVLPLTVPAAAGVLQPALSVLVERMAAKEPLGHALLAFGDELDDPSADLMVMALVMNADEQGRRLREVLSALARSARAELEVRRGVEAQRRSTRRGVRIIMIVTGVVVGGMALFNRPYVAEYHTAEGQVMLVVVVTLFGFGFWWMRRMSQYARPGRLIPAGGGPARELRSRP